MEDVKKKKCCLKLKRLGGLPWWPSGWDSVLPKQGAPGSIPGQGTRAHMLQLRSGAARKKKRDWEEFEAVDSGVEWSEGCPYARPKQCTLKMIPSSAPGHWLLTSLTKLFISVEHLLNTEHVLMESTLD